MGLGVMLTVGVLILVLASVTRDSHSLPSTQIFRDPPFTSGNDVSRKDGLRIYSRKDWGARPPKARSPLSTPVPFAVIHHTDTPSCNSFQACARRVRAIQNFHMDSHGWSDIGYNFLVGGDGAVYVGRGWDTLGAHAKGFNDVSIGVAIIGSYSTKVPNRAALQAAQQIIAMGVQRGKIAGSYTLVGHRQTNRVGYTDCPGDALMCTIAKWPHWKPYQKIGKFVMPKCPPKKHNDGLLKYLSLLPSYSSRNEKSTYLL